MPRIIKPAVGSFTASNITIDSSGRVIAASSGAGAANMVRTFASGANGTATFTAQPGTSKIHVYLKGAGGGGGGGGKGVPAPILISVDVSVTTLLSENCVEFTFAVLNPTIVSCFCCMKPEDS